ncbi:hypothetical protein [Mucilaginibacter psychrotolerans]|uniref:TonB-dependent receptor plug domain-containing protein n=1 Tax=Mucilaginibacter psychrotolerans TaxID=1524096 RepID=A0A4Y8SC65_9SPHI|nr:hypothetical protein [Mucilaginibacter psychrotolerans]TFF36512.1 hypothetical protein E2R66_15255 [Mucilaginibacter psychrotolerans]
MKSVTVCIACIILSVAHTFAQTDKATSLKEQAARLKVFFAQHEIEKVYLHFDKPYYAASDTIYFKAYVVAGEKNALSQLSGVLYADLIDPQNKITKAIKLPIANGLAWGDFALPDSLPAGNYRIRAYTKLMQSYGSELFFDRVIPVAAIINNTALKPTSQSKKADAVITAPDIQFFPEGGDLVAGVPCKVAFKAIIPAGSGINVTGTVFNKNNEAVVKFASVHLGMGAFSLMPMDGESYHADVLYADGRTQSVPLPAMRAYGVAMAVSDSAQKISVNVNPSRVFYEQNRNQPLGLFIYSGGRLTTVSDVMDGPDMRFDINKSGLRSGITQITLLSATGEPLCERLVFIDKDDKLPITVSLDKKTLKPRGQVKVNLHLDAADTQANKTHLSVTVIDRSKVLIDENKVENILTYLLFTSCLKGNIEEPGYYFTGIDAKKKAELDLVMLTHGYRRFNWRALSNNDVLPPTGPAEKGLSIAGIAKSIWGKPVKDGVVTLVPTTGGAFLTEKTDNAGTFSFKNLAFYDSTRFVLNAVNAKGGNNTELLYKPELPAPIADGVYSASTDTSSADIVRSYLQSSQGRHNDYLKYDGPSRQLKEVVIKSVKPATYRTQSRVGAGNADQVIHMADIKQTGMLSDILNGRLKGGVRFVKGGLVSSVDQSDLLIVVDGLERNDGSVDDILPSDVETIELLSPLGVKGLIYMNGSHGVLIITTKQGVGRDPKDIPSRGVLPLTVTGFYKAREFYAPRYDVVNNHVRPDLRSTIHWIPEITTDKNGDASFDFFNADGTGKYQIIIEGINNEGVAGAAKLIYEVKE